MQVLENQKSTYVDNVHVKEEEKDEDLFAEEEICGEEEYEVPQGSIHFSYKEEELLARFRLRGDMAENVSLFYFMV